MKTKGNFLKKPIVKAALCVILAAGLLGAGIGIGYALQPKAEAVQPTGYVSNPAYEYMVGAAAWQMSAEAHALMLQGFRLATNNVDAMVALADSLGVTTDFLLTGRVAGPAEADALSSLILSRVTTADRCLDQRKDRPFSREELAVLMAALLIEP